MPITKITPNTLRQTVFTDSAGVDVGAELVPSVDDASWCALSLALDCPGVVMGYAEAGVGGPTTAPELGGKI